MDAARTSTASTAPDHTFTGRGVVLNYRLQGVGSRALVCIHGVGSSLDAWEGVAASWKRSDPHVYGRFDLRYDGNGPAKLLEYNNCMN